MGGRSHFVQALLACLPVSGRLVALRRHVTDKGRPYYERLSEYLAIDPDIPRSIPGATRFSE
jgi:hypothetical protein